MNNIIYELIFQNEMLMEIKILSRLCRDIKYNIKKLWHIRVRQDIEYNIKKLRDIKYNIKTLRDKK